MYNFIKAHLVYFPTGAINCKKLYTKRYGVNCFSSSTTSTSFELPSSHVRLTLIKFTKQELVSQSVSELATGGKQKSD